MSALAYEGRGTSGPALLLLHAFPVDRRAWRGLMAELGGVARVVAPDLPGFGDSPPPSGDGPLRVNRQDARSAKIAQKPRG